MKIFKQHHTLFLYTFIIVIVDRFVKELAIAYLSEQKIIPIISDWFYLTLRYNTGVAFGFLGSMKFLVTAIVLAIVIIAFLYAPKIPKKLYIPTGLILGGAIGNLVDRFVIGSVIDFFAVKYFSVFNVADIAITIGVVILLIQFLLEDRQNAINKGKKKENIYKDPSKTVLYVQKEQSQSAKSRRSATSTSPKRKRSIRHS